MIASSDKAYGTQTLLPYREDAPLVGRHPYDVSKSCVVGKISEEYASTSGFPVLFVIVRAMSSASFPSTVLKLSAYIS